MHVVLTGGTGLIGKHLARSLRADGHRVTVLTRHPHPSLPEGVASVRWQPTAARANHGAGGAAGGRGGTGRLDTWTEVLGDADAVVHLAGAPIAAGRWTAARKRQIRESRVQSTRAVVQALARSQRRPGVLVSAAAVGYYGPRGDEVVTEEDGPGRDFLSEVARAWEEEALRAEALGVRVVLLRTGLVLDREEGALPRLLLPFRFFAGGPLGSGRQWMPWIHVDDEVGLIRFAIDREDARGPLNACAPNPVRNAVFCRTLGRVLGRPSWLSVPAAVLRLLLGELADALLLAGQRAVPARALALGYAFRFPDLESALIDLLGRGSSARRASSDG